jgi:NAD(P)H-dependent FMN reductase
MTTMSEKPKIGIIISTTRDGRFGDRPAEWIKDLGNGQGEAEFEIVDLKDYPLPFFEEPVSPARQAPANEVAQRWARRIEELDGYIFVTAEYNHGIPAVLKNALDYAYHEFNRKPAAFVGYGGTGGARAVQQLRLILAQLQVAPVSSAVHIGFAEMMALQSGEKKFADFAHLGASAKTMLADLAWWTKALTDARAKTAYARAA